MAAAPRQLLRTAIRLIDRLAGLGVVVAAAAVLLMTALITVEVLGRNLANVSTLVSDEFSGYLLVVITFFGVAHSLRSGGFVRVEFLYGRASGLRRAILDVVIVALALVFAAVLDWHLWKFALASLRYGTTSIYFTQTPLWIPQTCMALGGLLLTLQLLGGLGAASLKLLDTSLER